MAQKIKKFSKKILFLVLMSTFVLNIFNISNATNNDLTNGDKYALGSIITFGKYEQDNDDSNGKEDIEWKIMDSNDDYYLLLSLKILDCAQFNTTYGYVTYSNSTLRKFLNGTFYNSAFTESEKKQIFKVKNKNDANTKFNIDAGSDTDDNVFIFSLNEYLKYFGDMDKNFGNGNATTVGTMYAYGKGLDVNANEDLWCNGFSPYWLRTPGSYRTSAIYVSSNGGYIIWGDNVNYYYGVRPAMWVQLKK